MSINFFFKRSSPQIAILFYLTCKYGLSEVHQPSRGTEFAHNLIIKIELKTIKQASTIDPDLPNLASILSGNFIPIIADGIKKIRE
jgi:hypothetical protein